MYRTGSQSSLEVGQGGHGHRGQADSPTQVCLTPIMATMVIMTVMMISVEGS